MTRAGIINSGSCIATVRCQVIEAYSSNQMGRDSFGMGHGFIRCHREM